MRVGIPKEIKTLEFRVGMTPAGVHELVHDGHDVVVETNAGAGIGVSDADYEQVGASIAPKAKDIFDSAELIIKVKEPQLNECEMLSKGQVLFTYLHLAADPQQAEGLVKSGCTAIAYETVTDDRGGLPLLAPMSEVAGRLAPRGAFAGSIAVVLLAALLALVVLREPRRLSTQASASARSWATRSARARKQPAR